MLSFVFLVLTPALARAQRNQQAPLQEHKPELVIPLTLSDETTYSFESALSGSRQLSLEAIQEVESYGELNRHPQTVSINIAHDPAQPSTMALGPVVSVDGQDEIEWSDSRMPGENVPITHVGIRKGGMVSVEAYATRLALESPYIYLPSEIYDILVQATNPTPRQRSNRYDNVVNCDSLGKYPDLVLGLEPEIEEEEDMGIEDMTIEDREIVITPKQYILKNEQAQCILLVQPAHQQGREEVVLGWAAARGRVVVLDWVNGRTGFGR